MNREKQNFLLCQLNPLKRLEEIKLKEFISEYKDCCENSPKLD
jgi:hypothetical protein